MSDEVLDDVLEPEVKAALDRFWAQSPKFITDPDISFRPTMVVAFVAGWRAARMHAMENPT